MSYQADIPTILFGAFDRHNFGDLLFPHIVSALLDRKNLVFAGLAQRDLRCHGGHRLQSLAQLAENWRDHQVNIIHAGGEILTCDAWQAAVMLLQPDQAQDIVLRFDARPKEGFEWARHVLGISALAPYVVSRELFPSACSVICNAVGGMDFDTRDPALREEVLAKLGSADQVGVRDGRTQELLKAAGIAVRLMPDPAVMVAELFRETIGEHMQQGEVAQMLKAFPQGYVAVQFSTDFGDDKTLAAIADQLDCIARSSGYGIVFFRAGAAPWHDDLDIYRRIATRMRMPSFRIFNSVHLWDICALIAGSRCYAGSSLHGRIVAMAYALPRINLRYPAQAGQITKPEAFAATWDVPTLPTVVEVYELAHGIGQALAADLEQLQNTARELATQYREDFAAICTGLP